MVDLDSINLGFSRKAQMYDAYCESHPVIRWARGLARAQVLQHAPAGGAILELNAGTGADAAFFVERGYRVHATDVADGMVAEIAAKIEASSQGERFTVQQCSFTELGRASGGPYDVVFSNFGGLNCIPDLSAVTRTLPNLLKPGGFAVWVIMPPVGPWELAQALRGHWRTATRRLHRGGVLANVEGAKFFAYYFTPDVVARAFGPKFRRVSLQSFSLFCPPSYLDNFPKRLPTLTRWLMRMDEMLGSHWPFNRWGDYFILTMQFILDFIHFVDKNERAE